MAQFVMPSGEPERWLPVPEWEGLYEVSDLGRVRSLTRRTPAGVRKGRVLKASPDDTGRLKVSLSVGGKRTNARVSVLVALAFLGPRPADMVVCHNDGHLDNNAVSNLRYDTQSSNLLDKRIHGTDHQLNKTHCPRGHAYDEENTIHVGGVRRYRLCRRCVNDWNKERRKRDKAKLGTEPKRHGTEYAYLAFGCRCDLCRDSRAAACRRRKQERGAA